MFRVQVLFKRQWKWGLNDYETLEAAIARVQELNSVGIKARVKAKSELFN